jgi:hypothetical protein
MKINKIFSVATTVAVITNIQYKANIELASNTPDTLRGRY